MIKIEIKMKKRIIFVILILFLASYAAAAEPVLHFSDIVSGPKSGLCDGLGEGAIVTIWGNNLGSTQGSSKVYFKDSLDDLFEAAHVYYWENADPETGMSGPSDMWAYHKMQEIAFSIPSSAADGAGKIFVEVDGVNSNELDFTIRSGNIYYVKTGGDNSNGDGSWDNPWATVNYNDNGAASKVSAGDIIYICDGVEEHNTVAVRDAVEGNMTHPISAIAYPGADYLIQVNNSNAIGNYYWGSPPETEPNGAEYWNFAKVRVITNKGGYYSSLNGRVVGCSFTDNDCAKGMGGAIVVGRRHGGVKVFGNYVHDFGCNETDSLHHVTYMTNRIGSIAPAPELGWNFFIDNEAPGGLHTYDHTPCGDWNGTYRIHDNVVMNQVGPGIDLMGSCWTMDIEVYNNLIINSGLAVPAAPGSLPKALSIQLGGSTSDVSMYNNVFYGSESKECMLHFFSFSGKFDFKNNIVVDSNDVPFSCSQNPTGGSNNIYYDGGNGIPDLSSLDWDPDSMLADPLFFNPENGDFSLQPGSPAIDNGTLDASFVKRDLFGTSRPSDGDGSGTAEYDVGVFEYTGDLSGGPILYENDFDDKPDFESTPGAYGLASTHAEALTIGFSDYRSDSGNEQGGVKAIVINSANRRGAVGKGLGITQESNRDGPGTWWGPHLGIHFADPDLFDETIDDDGYEELFVSWWQKWDWPWDDILTEGFQIKMFRAYSNTDWTARWNSGEPLSCASGEDVGLFGDWAEYGSHETPYWYPCYRVYNDFSADSQYDVSCEFPDDSNWHYIVHHIKMNTVGETNCINDVYVDGELCGSFSSPMELRTSEVPNRKFVNICLFDNSYIPYGTPGEDEWTYYIDDIVISTEYIGPDDDSTCKSGADKDESSSVSIDELIAFIDAWKNGGVTINQIIIAIGEWKSGC